MISNVKIDVFIDKNIPLEAGLAGGSANAAATLRALNKFFEDNFNWSLSQKELMKLAADIGSDVPFCLQALEQPRCFGESRGEKLSSLKEASTKQKFTNDIFDKYSQLIIVKPKFGISTAEAYTLFSGMTTQEAINSKTTKKPPFFNRFEDLIFEHYPELVTIQETLVDIGCDYVLLSGSGSAMLGFVNNKKNLDEVFEEAEDNFTECEIFKARFLLN
jgi:4-diphosphocytidyl-2-C-methyl-D-erythritol kinase